MKGRIVPLAIFLTLAWSTSASAMGPTLLVKVLADEMEYGFDDTSNPIGFNVVSWFGGDWNRVWLKTEGEFATTGLEFDGEGQLLYSRLISPFWELQLGLRGDLVLEDETLGRGFLVLGLEGLIPYRFEFVPALFVSHEGDVSTRLELSYDIFLTQRLIAVPSLEVNLAVQSVPKFGVGQWLNSTDLQLRIRYEISRKFAPYLGGVYEQTYLEAADFKKAAGQKSYNLRAVVGLRFWF